MFKWLKVVNRKNLSKDPALKKNQPKDGKISLSEDIDIDGSIDVDFDGIHGGSIEIIKKF